MERRHSALPKIHKVSSLPKHVSQQKAQNGFIHRTHSTPNDHLNFDNEEEEEEDEDEEIAFFESTHLEPPGMTRNVHSLPSRLAHLQQVTTAWGQAKQTTRTKQSHRVSSGLTMRMPQSMDGAYERGNEVASERRRRKLSPGDDRLPALSPTNHSSPRKLYAKPNT